MGRPDYSRDEEVYKNTDDEPYDPPHSDTDLLSVLGVPFPDLDEDATPDEVLANEEKKKAAEQKVLDDLAAAAVDEADEETPLDDGNNENFSDHDPNLTEE